MRALWLPDWPPHSLPSGALIRVLLHHNCPTNSLQSEALNQPTKFVWSEAVIRVDWLPDQRTNLLQSGALIRVDWLPNWPTNSLWSGALIRADWLPDLLSELRTPQTNKLLVIRSSFDSLIHQQNPYNGSYHQILLTLRSTHKVMMVTFSPDDWHSLTFSWLWKKLGVLLSTWNSPKKS